MLSLQIVEINRFEKNLGGVVVGVVAVAAVVFVVFVVGVVVL